MFDCFEEEHFNSYKKDCDNFKNSLGTDEKWKKIDCESNLKINDNIYIEYLPYSQKYLYTHTPECGTIVEIKESGDIIIKNHKNILLNIEKDHLGLYSKAYDMILKKLES